MVSHSVTYCSVSLIERDTMAAGFSTSKYSLRMTSCYKNYVRFPLVTQLLSKVTRKGVSASDAKDGGTKE